MLSFIYGTLIDTLLRNVRRLVVKLSGLEVSDMVIDVCCGTGAQVLEYGRQGITAVPGPPHRANSLIQKRKKIKHRTSYFNSPMLLNYHFRTTILIVGWSLWDYMTKKSPRGIK